MALPVQPEKEINIYYIPLVVRVYLSFAQTQACGTHGGYSFFLRA